MKRKLFFLIGVMCLGVLLVSGVVFYQTSRVLALISVDSRLALEISHEAAEVEHHFLDIKSAVALIENSESSSEIELLSEKLTADLTEMSEHTGTLASEKFSDFHNFTLNLEGQDSPIPVRELVNRISENNKLLTETLKGTVDSRSQVLEKLKTLERKRAELGKVYRDSFALKEYSEEAFQLMTRSLLTTMSSDSVRDLNFVGRKRFEDAVALFDGLRLSRADRETWESYKKIYMETLELALSLGSTSGDFQAVVVRLDQDLKMIQALVEFASTQLAASQESVIGTASSTRTVTVLTGLMIVFLSLGFGYALITAILKALRAVNMSLTSAGHGVFEASHSLKDTSGKLSQGAARSATFLEETVSSLTEISSNTTTSVEIAKECAELAEVSSGQAQSGQTNVKKLVGLMREMNVTSKKISEILTVIDDIAFQTNLLALNAAVEAARAGEQGRGFAVVADAVRALAQRTASSAKDIERLIRESMQQMEAGIQSADQSEDAIGKIVNTIEDLKMKSRSMAQASEETSVGIQEVSRALNELDQVAQNTAASAESTSESSDGLSARAEDLKKAVGSLSKLLDEKAA